MSRQVLSQVIDQDEASHWLAVSMFDVAAALDDRASAAATVAICRHARAALYFALRRCLMVAEPAGGGVDAQFALACVRAAHARAHAAAPGGLAFDATPMPRMLEFHAEFCPAPRLYIWLRACGLQPVFAVAVADSAPRGTLSTVVAAAARMVVEQHVSHGIALDVLVEARAVDAIRDVLLAAAFDMDAADTLVNLAAASEHRLAAHFNQRLGRPCN